MIFAINWNTKKSYLWCSSRTHGVRWNVLCPTLKCTENDTWEVLGGQLGSVFSLKIQNCCSGGNQKPSDFFILTCMILLRGRGVWEKAWLVEGLRFWFAGWKRAHAGPCVLEPRHAEGIKVEVVILPSKADFLWCPCERSRPWDHCAFHKVNCAPERKAL